MCMHRVFRAALAAAAVWVITPGSSLAQFCEVTRLGTLSIDVAFEVEVEGPTLFTRSIGSIRIIDVSDPTAPTLVSTIEGVDAVEMEVVGSTLYAIDFFGRLLIFDVSDPTAPVELSRIDIAGPRFLEVVGNTAIVASQFAPIVTLFDVTDPSRPAQISEIRLDDRLESLHVRWPNVFLSNTDSLITLDISDPANPRELDRFDSGLDGVSFIDVQGSLAFVREARGADRLLQLVHVGRPEAMRLFKTGSFDFQQFGPPYIVQDGWLISNARFADMAIHGLEDPARPRLIGTFEIDGGSEGITLVGDRLYVVTRSGLQIFDIGGCPPYRFCPADLNADGVADFFDTQEFALRYSRGELQADFDGDGVLTPADLAAFQAAVADGCP